MLPMNRQPGKVLLDPNTFLMTHGGFTGSSISKDGKLWPIQSLEAQQLDRIYVLELKGQASRRPYSLGQIHRCGLAWQWFFTAPTMLPPSAHYSGKRTSCIKFLYKIGHSPEQDKLYFSIPNIHSLLFASLNDEESIDVPLRIRNG